MQLRIKEGKNPWYSEEPVASIIILSLGGQSKWTIEVRVRSAAAFISINLFTS